MAKAIRLLNGDLLVEHYQRSNIEKYSIALLDREDGTHRTNFFRVVAVAPGVEDVKQGDVVLLDFNMHTQPFLWDGKRVAVTDISKVLAMVEPD